MTPPVANPEVARSESQHSPIKRCKLIDDTIVTVIVGEQKRLFKIHKNLFCSASEFFNAALDGKFKEAEEREINLAEEDPDIRKELLKIYVFAEARCITHLQNDTIDVIIRKEEKTGVIMVPGAEVDMYASTTDSSPIRRLAVNMAAYNVASGRVEWELTNWPKQYLIDLALAFWRSKANGYWAEKKDFWAQRCDYHVHTTTEPQCANVPNPG
ncbi:hypothetical protein MMC34_005498 [Xylographa carneopallida]|nr:hypothetical protein [Xylographa carneopallida]